MKCFKNKSCNAPMACGSFGYCRERNIDAGGMDNVTTAMQQEWIWMDNLGHVWGVYDGQKLHATFEDVYEADGFVKDQPEGFLRYSIFKLGEQPQ